MLPVTQSKNAPPDGDCFAACIASLLELRLDQVPNPIQDTADCWEQWNEWLGRFGLVYWEYPADTDWRPEGYWVGLINVGGEWDHACVYHGRELVWNPTAGWTVEGTLALAPRLIGIGVLAVTDAGKFGRLQELGA